MPQRRLQTAARLEAQLQINHLAHFVLLDALLERLEKNAPSRILMVGSLLHSLYVDIVTHNVITTRGLQKSHRLVRSQLRANVCLQHDGVDRTKCFL